MMPPISIDGTDITGATIDGTDVTEITVDGQTVFSAVPDIPDSEDLHARFDWTQASGTTTVEDQTGNGHDLSGTYTGPTASINGNQAGRFDGADDAVGTTFSAVSMPFHIFTVLVWQNIPSSFRYEYGDDADNQPRFGHDGSSNWFVGGDGGALFGSSVSTNEAYITGTLFNGTNSELRVNGSVDVSGDAGSQTLDGFIVGDRQSGTGDYGEFDVGEILIYETDKSASVSEIESYLAIKWGITL